MSDTIRAQIFDLQGIPHEDLGFLGVAEYGPHIPFVPRRLFFFCDVPIGTTRGGHGHRELEQFIGCPQGAVLIETLDAAGKQSFCLDTPLQGLYIPAMTWVDIRFEGASTVALVLASAEYDEADYIRDMGEFERICIQNSNREH
jgi:dTDP-4-dehydrorhamnose 3,5-epimerase-like enzyme